MPTYKQLVIGFTAVLVVTAAVLIAATAGGSEHQSRGEVTRSEASSVSPMQRRYNSAVMQFAKSMYASQDMRSASCDKVGFTPGGDTLACSLRLADGTATARQEWQFATGVGADGADVAFPQAAADNADTEGCVSTVGGCNG
jgi:hypothetical protein